MRLQLRIGRLYCIEKQSGKEFMENKFSQSSNLGDSHIIDQFNRSLIIKGLVLFDDILQRQYNVLASVSVEIFQNPIPE